MYYRTPYEVVPVGAQYVAKADALSESRGVNVNCPANWRVASGDRTDNLVGRPSSVDDARH